MPGPKIELAKIHFRASPRAVDTFCGMHLRIGERYLVVVPTEKYINDNIGAPFCRTCFRVFEQQDRDLQTTV